MTHYSDKDLWDLIKKGNKKAFDYLYQQNVRGLYYFGFKITQDKGLVEDCIQEVFINIWNSRQSIQIEHSAKHYLLLSLRRLLLRKLKNAQKLVASSDNLEEIQRFEVEISIETAWIQEEMKKGSSQKLKKAINQLSNREKEAIYLRYYENVSYEEIASIMGIGIKAVYKVVHSGIKKLRQLLH